MIETDRAPSRDKIDGQEDYERRMVLVRQSFPTIAFEPLVEDPFPLADIVLSLDVCRCGAPLVSFGEVLHAGTSGIPSSFS